MWEIPYLALTWKGLCFVVVLGGGSSRVRAVWRGKLSGLQLALDLKDLESFVGVSGREECRQDRFPRQHEFQHGSSFRWVGGEEGETTQGLDLVPFPIKLS